MKYIHKNRIVTIEKSDRDNKLYVETIEEMGNSINKMVAYYRIANGEKVYTGAGGGSIEEDYINPVELEEEGKIIILDSEKKKIKKVGISGKVSIEIPRVPSDDLFCDAPGSDDEMDFIIGDEDSTWEPPTMMMDNMWARGGAAAGGATAAAPTPSNFIRIPSLGSLDDWGADVAAATDAAATDAATNAAIGM